MLRKPKSSPASLPTIPAELLEQFSNGPMTAESINAASQALKKALIERALAAEMSHHYCPTSRKVTLAIPARHRPLPAQSGVKNQHCLCRHR